MLLEVRDLHKSFGSGKTALPAVRGIDLDIQRGQTVGLVGESGCGKTTLGRVVVGLYKPTSGQITFDGQEMAGQLGAAAYRRRVQMVFQHPMQSLNPRYRVGTTLREPLKLLNAAQPSEIDDRVDEVLRLVGLGPAYRSRRPRELSGGQQQRVAIARALIPGPDLVVLDEPTSSLDQSVRGRIIALLRSIQEERGVAYLFISHDLSTVRRIASVVAVMYLGRIVEIAPTEAVFESPQHPYTKALLSAVPTMDLDTGRERIVLPGETPSPLNLPVGCSFQERCPLVHDRCRNEYPQLEWIDDESAVECFAVQSGMT
ncbi:MAG: ABC transporter ATP-binding protein [Acidimicrobiia bacterium]